MENQQKSIGMRHGHLLRLRRCNAAPHWLVLLLRFSGHWRLNQTVAWCASQMTRPHAYRSLSIYEAFAVVSSLTKLLDSLVGEDLELYTPNIKPRTSDRVMDAAHGVMDRLLLEKLSWRTRCTPMTTLGRSGGTCNLQRS